MRKRVLVGGILGAALLCVALQAPAWNAWITCENRLDPDYVTSEFRGGMSHEEVSQSYTRLGLRKVDEVASEGNPPNKERLWHNCLWSPEVFLVEYDSVTGTLRRISWVRNQMP